MTKRFLKIKELSELTGLPIRTIRSLTQKRKLPCIRTGYRTLFYDPAKVLLALEKFELRAVA